TDDPALRARAIWAIDYDDPGSNRALAAAFRDDDQRFRVLDVRETVGKGRTYVTENWEEFFLEKPSLAVYREALVQILRHEDPNSAKPVFFKFAKQYDGKDHFYRAALNIACGTDPERRKAILADFDKHFPEWNDKVADL